MKIVVAMLSAASLMFVVGCDQSASSTAEKAKSAAKDAGNAVKDAAHSAKDAAHSAGDAMKDAAHKAGDAAHGALDSLKAEGNKWITDTIEKQWPAAKQSLADLETKAAGVKDAGVKANVDSAIKGLKDQVPQLEGLVNQLKNYTTGTDYSTLLTKAKDMFAGFMKKIDEVKNMLPK